MKSPWRAAAALIVVCAGLMMSGCSRPMRSAAPEGHWISLFNGHDLDGWVPKFAGSPLGVNLLDTFRVENGLLRVSYDKYDKLDGRIGHLFYYRRPFSHYWVRVEYRFVGEAVRGAPGWAIRNNGVMLHSQPPQTMGRDQVFPDSVELRLLGVRLRKRITGSVCTPGTSVLFKGERSNEQCLDSSAPVYRGSQWVVAEAYVEGDKVVRHYINGQQVMEYTDLRLDAPRPWSPTLALKSGFIAIQAESHPTDFRRIEILDLDEPGADKAAPTPR